MIPTAAPFHRIARTCISDAFGISRNYQKRLTSRGFVPCRTIHASSASRLRQSPLPKARNYYGGSGGNSRNGFTSRLRYFFDSIPGSYLVYGIIAIDVAVWAGFQVAESALKMRDAKPLMWLYNNMTSSWDNLMQGRIWTLITPAFAHQQGGHLFMNALGLYMFCPWVAQSIGSFAFLNVYLIGAIGTSLFSIYWNKDAKGRHRSLGASGAICSIMSFTACLAPRTSVALYGIIPMPLWGVVVGIFLYDLYGARTGHGSTDFAGHLGGTFTGIGMYFLRSRLGIRGLY